MKVAVWDTYVNRKDGSGEMHFDILVPEGFEDRAEIKKFGMKYLEGKHFRTEELKMDKCDFCHIEQASVQIENEIEEVGYVIIEISNCD